MNHTPKHYLISGKVALDKKIPASFIGTPLAESKKAIYIYGRGRLDPTGRCVRCGRTLTHPGSIVLGIGPECLGDWGLRDIKLDSLTKEDKKKLKKQAKSIVVDGWFAKSMIKEELETTKKIKVPAGHPILKGKDGTRKMVSDTKKAILVGSEFKVYFPYERELVEAIKAVPNRRYKNSDRNDIHWTVPYTDYIVVSLNKWGFQISGLSGKQMAGHLDKVAEVEDRLPTDSEVTPIQPDGLKLELRPYQKLGVATIDRFDGRLLLGDDMGLGKTAQGIGYMQLRPQRVPVVIVCPASVKYNWQKEIYKWMPNPPQVIILSGRAGSLLERNPKNTIYIINYDILSNQYSKKKLPSGKIKETERPRTGWVDYLKDIGPKLLITDECQYYKTQGVKRTKAVFKLADGIRSIIPMSGTPIESRPIEIFNAAHLVNPADFPSWFKFAQRYCKPKHNGFAWEYNGASNTQELHDLLKKGTMLRRLKADVASELPEKNTSFIPMKLDSWGSYAFAKENFLDYVTATKGKEASERASNAEALTQISVLRQVAVEQKMTSVLQWVDDFMRGGDEKLVIFAHHKVTISNLMDAFGNMAVKIDGSVPSAKRQEVITKFQTADTVRVIVCNIKSAGVGIDGLQDVCNNVAFVELPWTPGALAQAIDRLHRIGATSKFLNIFYLLAINTIEEDMAEWLDEQMKNISQVLDGKDVEETSLVKYLMELPLMLRRKKK